MAGFANVLSDARAVGRMAAQYLLKAGYRQFVVVADSVGLTQRERAEAFEEELAKAGIGVRRFEYDFLNATRAMSVRVGWSRARFQKEIGEVVRPWLEGMELGAAIFATNDWLANLVLKTIGLDFPEHRNTVGVLGVDNDQAGWYPGVLPGLSSVRPGFGEMGRRAMGWLFENPGRRGVERMGEYFELMTPSNGEGCGPIFLRPHFARQNFSDLVAAGVVPRRGLLGAWEMTWMERSLSFIDRFSGPIQEGIRLILQQEHQTVFQNVSPRLWKLWKKP